MITTRTVDDILAAIKKEEDEATRSEYTRKEQTTLPTLQKKFKELLKATGDIVSDPEYKALRDRHESRDQGYQIYADVRKQALATLGGQTMGVEFYGNYDRIVTGSGHIYDILTQSGEYAGDVLAVLSPGEKVPDKLQFRLVYIDRLDYNDLDYSYRMLRSLVSSAAATATLRGHEIERGLKSAKNISAEDRATLNTELKKIQAMAKRFRQTADDHYPYNSYQGPSSSKKAPTKSKARSAKPKKR